MDLAGRFDRLLVATIRLVFAFAGAALLFYGLALLCYQVIFWLQWQQWQGCTVLDVMSPAYSIDGPITWMPTSSKASGWLANPNRWYGLHSIVVWILGHIPFGIACIGMGTFLTVTGGNMKPAYEDAPPLR